MTYEDATIAVEQHLHSSADELNRFGSALPGYKNPEIELQILHERTETHEFGWVFFYNSRKYIETQNTGHALGGNAPLIYDKRCKKIIATGTAHPVSYYVKNYIETGNPQG